MLEIAASVKDFNLTDTEIKDFKVNENIVVPDPIVLHPVMYNDIKYYLVVTAWGDEASDKLIK